MKAFISTLLASIAIATPALAAPLPADHQQFLDTMARDGVNVYINEPAQACFDGSKMNGSYVVFEGERFLVVCQDNRKSSDVVAWTANDLDTIRHEGFHIIQDCMAGANNDMVFDTVFTNHDDVIDNLGVPQAMHIMSTYADAYGSDRHGDIQYEIEAFYAARDYSATELNSMYHRYCM